MTETLDLSLGELNHRMIAAADAVYAALDEYRTRNAAWVKAERDYRYDRATNRPQLVGTTVAEREDELFLRTRQAWFQAEMAKALRDTAKEALRACQAVLSGLQSVASAHREEARLSMYSEQR